jgi:hypothetical protein
MTVMTGAHAFAEHSILLPHAVTFQAVQPLPPTEQVWTPEPDAHMTDPFVQALVQQAPLLHAPLVQVDDDAM